MRLDDPDHDVSAEQLPAADPGELTDHLLEQAAATISSLARAVGGLKAESAALRTALAETRGELEQSRLNAPTVEHLAGEVLLTAHRAAELTQEDSRQQAEQLLADARTQAKAILGEAKQQERQAERAQTKELVAKAQDQADTILREAEREREQIKAETVRLQSLLDETKARWTEIVSQALAELNEQEAARVDTLAGTEPHETAAEIETELRARLEPLTRVDPERTPTPMPTVGDDTDRPAMPGEPRSQDAKDTDAQQQPIVSNP